jgi:hypothetical protein
MNQKLGLHFEAGIEDLLFRPVECWMIGDVEVDNLSIRDFHDDENEKDPKSNCVLHKEVAAPNALSLVFQEASPGLGINWFRTPFDHVSSDSGTGVANGKLHL